MFSKVVYHNKRLTEWDVIDNITILRSSFFLYRYQRLFNKKSTRYTAYFMKSIKILANIPLLKKKTEGQCCRHEKEDGT